ncbi:hypothetical protein AGMMS50230_05590 [Spirochaetia bacterium]|nr:hypothetical protein AGMMS50230_05590 [Spirochaetia bacterium]
MIKRVVLDKHYVLSPESIARLKALENREVDTSDIPEATQDELQELKQQLMEKRKKQMFSLRLSNATVQWWQSLGAGYTSVMARFLDEARNHPEWVRGVL